MNLKEAQEKAKLNQEQETNKFVSHYVTPDAGMSILRHVSGHSRSPELGEHYRLYPVWVLAGDCSEACPAEWLDEDCWEVSSVDWSDW
jgi:hypothetical protein